LNNLLFRSHNGDRKAEAISSELPKAAIERGGEERPKFDPRGKYGGGFEHMKSMTMVDTIKTRLGGE
jgi:hypothetical protein